MKTKCIVTDARPDTIAEQLAGISHGMEKVIEMEPIDRHALESLGFTVKQIGKTRAQELLEAFPIVVKGDGIAFGFKEDTDLTIAGRKTLWNQLMPYCAAAVRVDHDIVLKEWR